MLKRMNSPRKHGTAASTAPCPPARLITMPSRCPPLPLEIWTQIMRTLVHSEDLPELWTGLRLLSHTLKAAVETAFVDEHLSRVRAWLYVGDPSPLIPQRPWADNLTAATTHNNPNNHNTSNRSLSTTSSTQRVIPLPLFLSRLSSDRRRAHFVSRLHRDDAALRISPRYAECADDTLVVEWLRSARGIPPPGRRATEARLCLTVGPDCAWTHWKHPVIGSDGFVVESRSATLEDEEKGEGEDKGERGGEESGSRSNVAGGGDDIGNNGSGEVNRNGERKGTAARAIRLQVDRTKCEISFDWVPLVTCVFAQPRKTFGEALRG